MRAAHQLDRGLLTADGRQRQPYIEARVVMGGATAVVVRMPMQASVPIGQAADACKYQRRDTTSRAFGWLATVA
jgi:hypothetical protein